MLKFLGDKRKRGVKSGGNGLYFYRDHWVYITMLGNRNRFEHSLILKSSIIKTLLFKEFNKHYNYERIETNFVSEI